jgi:uncharacterized protein (TIGR04222 family)
VLALVDRGLLIADNTWIERAAHATQKDTHNAVEAAVLRAVVTRTSVDSILNDVSLKKECNPYREKLEAGGLLPDESTKRQRRRIFLLASMALAGVGVIKIAIGLSRDRPILFLSILTIAAVHLAGGRWIGASGARRLLDDHLHDVPEPVYDLLAEVGARAPYPLTVILERDGRYPPIEILLDQLERARRSLAAGRARRVARTDRGAA